jgi:hypothetical protein
MKGTAEALKATGIEFVVLLSSYTIGRTLHRRTCSRARVSCTRIHGSRLR